jgi:hypothetical protein
MQITPDALLKQVAQLAADEAPESWRILWVKSQIGDDWAESVFDAESSSKARHWYEPSLETQYRINTALQKLRCSMAEQTPERWSGVQIQLTADGEFVYKFLYEDSSSVAT